MSLVEWLELLSAVFRLLNSAIAPVLMVASFYNWFKGNRELATYLAVLVVIAHQHGVPT